LFNSRRCSFRKRWGDGFEGRTFGVPCKARRSPRCLVTLLPAFHRSLLRFLRFLLYFLLLLHVLLHRVPRLGLRGIGVGTGNGGDEKRLTEKDKQDTSCNFLHKLSMKQALGNRLWRHITTRAAGDEESFPLPPERPSSRIRYIPDSYIGRRRMRAQS
jgi:hypothetical protein